MPAAIPLIGAAFSVAGGVAAAGGMAAIAAGGLSAIGLTSGLMIAGGALTGIGALTGNKKLMTLGSIVGLAGGISNFAAKAGETAATATAEAATQAAADAGASTTANVGGQVTQGGAPTLAEAAANTSAQAGAGAAGQAPAGLAGGPAPGGLIADAAPGINPGAVGTGPLPGGLQGPGVDPSGLNAAAGMDMGGPAALGVDPAAPGVGPAAQGMNPMQGPDVGGMPADPTAAALAPQGPGAASPNMGTYATEHRGFYPDMQAQNQPGDWWSKVKEVGAGATKWMKENPEATKLGSGLLQGAMMYQGQQQIAQDNMKRQMAYQDWARQRYSDSMKNLTIPSIVRSSPGAGGIIGGARS